MTLIQKVGDSLGFGTVSFQGEYYQQTGYDRDGKNLGAYHWMIQATYQKGRISITPGYDVMSGNDSTTAATDNKAFDPLYGCPHCHYGNMDYFYAGTGSPTGGLADAYVRMRYATKVLTAGADFRSIGTAKQMKGTSGKKLGDEIDVRLNYAMNRISNIELGGSVMMATDNLSIAKAQAQNVIYNKTGTWCYLMLTFKPDFLYSRKK